MGGTLALELYDRYPEAAVSLILADTYAGWKGSLPEAACARAPRLGPAHIRDGAERADLALATRAAVGGRVSTFHPAGARLMAQAMAEADLRDVLPRIRVPTLLLWGEQDQRSPAGIAQDLRAAIPGARLALIPGAGHDSNMEEPARFRAEVREFCRSVTTRRGDNAPWSR